MRQAPTLIELRSCDIGSTLLSLDLARAADLPLRFARLIVWGVLAGVRSCGPLASVAATSTDVDTLSCVRDTTRFVVSFADQEGAAYQMVCWSIRSSGLLGLVGRRTADRRGVRRS